MMDGMASRVDRFGVFVVSSIDIFLMFPETESREAFFCFYVSVSLR